MFVILPLSNFVARIRKFSVSAEAFLLNHRLIIKKLCYTTVISVAGAGKSATADCALDRSRRSKTPGRGAHARNHCIFVAAWINLAPAAALGGALAHGARVILIDAIRQAHRWLGNLLSNPNETVEAIASREGKTERSIRMTLSLAFLAPDIVKAAIDGRLPRGFGADGRSSDVLVRPMAGAGSQSAGGSLSANCYFERKALPQQTSLERDRPKRPLRDLST